MREWMWQHPDLFTWTLCLGSAAVAYGILKLVYGLKGKD